MASVGDRVRIHYTGRLEDGTVFDSSREREPFEFEVGSEEVIPGLDRTVQQMTEGDSTTVTLEPEEGFGHPEPALAQRVQREQLPDDVGEGDTVRAEVDGRAVNLVVRDLTDETAVVDANHPLAGEKLVFDVELVQVVANA